MVIKRFFFFIGDPPCMIFLWENNGINIGPQGSSKQSKSGSRMWRWFQNCSLSVWNLGVAGIVWENYGIIVVDAFMIIDPTFEAFNLPSCRKDWPSSITLPPVHIVDTPNINHGRCKGWNHIWLVGRVTMFHGEIPISSPYLTRIFPLISYN